jgi:acetylornithine deacetylase/succinyl-diaminopimelate desuccinylase-like protein
VARGTSGHGSVPRDDNAITHLAAAVAKIGNWQAPMRLNETTREFFARLAKISSAEDAWMFANLEDKEKSLQAQEKIRSKYPNYYSMLRTSLVPTIIKGGFRSNVIPGDAEATLDVRAVPDEDIPALVESLKKLVNDPAVEIIAPSGRGRPATPPSSISSEMFKALERAQKQMFANAVTLPMMLTGATDSAQLRNKGVQAYGLGSVVNDKFPANIHGNDERLSIEGYGKFVEFIYRSVFDIASAK